VLRRALLAATVAALVSCGGVFAYLLTPARAGAAGTTSTSSTTSTATVTTAAKSVLVLRGHGWGHGLGMSQWGAKGFADHGWTYDRILAHYYRGTTLGPAPVAKVRVLLFEGAKKAVLGSTTPWRVIDAEGNITDLEPRKLTLTPGLKIDGTALPGPLTFAPAGSPLLVGNKPYRGTIVVTVGNGKLHVVNAVGLEAYIKGVVASEMPSAWPADALEAQAIAARSYALANLAKGRSFDLYDDVRSQVYGGVSAEAPSTNAAVDATARQVVLYAGKVATTYFFSTSGGRTVSAAEVTGKPVPYLVSVADPYDTASPYHNWGPMLLDAAKVAKQLKLQPPLTDLELVNGPSGRVQDATAVGADGEVEVTGPKLRTMLGLRSTWFSAGWLSLTPPLAPVTFGGAATLAGTARGVGPVMLESRAPGGVWAPVGPLSPDATGAFTTIVRPQVTTEYRLAAGTAPAAVRAALLRVPVVPLVSATPAADAVTGTVRPATLAAPVQLQVQDGTTWTTIATGTTDAAGGYAVTAGLTTGTYRIRCAPGKGLAPGVSATFVVP
jgi:SpoIID/LytB domain protein